MNEEVASILNKINENIFEYKVDELNKNIVDLIDYIQLILKEVDSKYLDIILNILLELENAYENKDYLLYSDIIEYELKSVISEVRK
ncbi:hypothetical protein EUAN_17350 [Andreesenia angusta]|uniref:Uncharacterized protein n=1 Tax=Andreesenia angusta TaxID=39480 RepID=A0A1S1V5M7_9FIRM|nr:hypothetical protein [Andreesenia angusta]OHW61971.1 hypothetical protein EUAN_17350 [Andreesenia angusta]